MKLMKEEALIRRALRMRSIRRTLDCSGASLWE